jgi:hypothetical protein
VPSAWVFLSLFSFLLSRFASLSAAPFAELVVALVVLEEAAILVVEVVVDVIELVVVSFFAAPFGPLTACVPVPSPIVLFDLHRR